MMPQTGTSLLHTAICVLSVAACNRTPEGFIPDRVSCRSCEIHVEDLALVGDTGTENSLTGRPWELWIDNTGRYWINVLDAFPMIYDPARGKLEDFARPGGGPGEYRHPTIRAALPGDSMLVSDRFTFRVLGHDLNIQREIRVNQDLPRIVVLQWPTDVLAVTMPHDPMDRTVRTVVAKYDMSGDRAFVTDTILSTAPTAGRGVEWANSFRLLGRRTPQGEVWISDYNHYRLIRYSSEGEARDTIRRRPSWFPGGEAMRLGGPDEPTTPHMMGNWVDEQGRLWTLAALPRQGTRKAWEGVASFEGAREVRVANLPAAYELNQTVIEVIDISARRVLARMTFDGYFIAVLPDQRVASFTETAAGVPVLKIHRLSLRGDK